MLLFLEYLQFLQNILKILFLHTVFIFELSFITHRISQNRKLKTP